MRLWPKSVLLLAVLLVTASPVNKLAAQTTTSGGLTGVVTDPSHAVVPGAVVEMKDNAKGTVQSAKTDGNGVYRFFLLAPSSYSLTVTHAGFRKVNRTVTVLLGPLGTVNVPLEIATENTAIEVTGEAPLLQAENGDASTTMNEKQISEVPNPGNDLTYITQTAPGAIMNTESQASGTSGGSVSILGMPGTSNLFTLNGMNNNNIQMNVGFYGQEEWHARSNLTLTLALRADHQSSPVCESHCFARFSGPSDSINHDPDQPYDQAILVNRKQAFLNTDTMVWSPRLSFAWQPLGVSHNTVLRGGIGIFCDPVPGAIGQTHAYNPPLWNPFAVTAPDRFKRQHGTLII